MKSSTIFLLRILKDITGESAASAPTPASCPRSPPSKRWRTNSKRRNWTSNPVWKWNCATQREKGSSIERQGTKRKPLHFEPRDIRYFFLLQPRRRCSRDPRAPNVKTAWDLPSSPLLCGWDRCRWSRLRRKKKRLQEETVLCVTVTSVVFDEKAITKQRRGNIFLCIITFTVFW